MCNNKVKMYVEMDVTIPQALALQAMFEYWNALGRNGSSREVGFYCDGDGNFRPECKIGFDKDIPQLTDKIRANAILRNENGNLLYDFDRLEEVQE